MAIRNRITLFSPFKTIGTSTSLWLIVGFCLLTGIALEGQTFNTLYSFSGQDGANPYAGLVQGRDGNFYGTTIGGGAQGSGNFFRVTPDGNLTPLYDFCSQAQCTDGQFPNTSLLQGADGNFYGTTQSGGANNGFGTVFKITPYGKLTILHSFNGVDGASPYGSMVLAVNGDFYGTSNQGGPHGAGTVFRISPNGNFINLYNFCSQNGCSDGGNPIGPLIQATDGSIYGTAHTGRNSACKQGCGTVFKITAAGALTTVHTFDGTDGEYPSGGVVQSAPATFAGTTSAGGPNHWGTIFRLTSSGKMTVLHNFNGDDGSNSNGLCLGSDGNFYGTTSTGGSSKTYGNIFEVTANGVFSVLHQFEGPDGKNPDAGLIQGTNGTLFGTTYFGGTDDDGTLFTLSLGLRPFVQIHPAGGKVGANVEILGSDLRGVTSVTFNGTAAKFTIVSRTLITTTVPAGATTGSVRVSNGQQSLSTTVPFVIVR